MVLGVTKKAEATPTIRIGADGSMKPLDEPAKAVLAELPGTYRVVRIGSLLLMDLDEGSGAAPRPGEEVVLAGSLRGGTLLGLLNLFAQNRDTGRLVLRRRSTERVVMLRDGDVASVGSNAPEDRLGRFLVRLGKVSEEQLHAAELDARHEKKRIGQVLVAQGLLGAHELWSTIQAQITEIFSDVVQWADGSFLLYRLPEGFAFPSTPPMSMQGLMLESLRRADEFGVFREKIPHAGVLLSPTGKEPRTGLEELESRALDAIGAGATVEEVCRRLHLPEFDGTSACFALWKKKFITLSDPQPEKPSSTVVDDEGKGRLEVYNLAFHEIRDEMTRHNKVDEFVHSVEGYLRELSGQHAELFRGLTLDASGALPARDFLRNLARVGAADPGVLLQEALNELTFFMLFQCGELLDAQSDENLGRRVRLIHAALTAPPTAASPSSHS